MLVRGESGDLPLFLYHKTIQENSEIFSFGDELN